MWGGGGGEQPVFDCKCVNCCSYMRHCCLTVHRPQRVSCQLWDVGPSASTYQSPAPHCLLICSLDYIVWWISGSPSSSLSLAIFTSVLSLYPAPLVLSWAPPPPHTLYLESGIHRNPLLIKGEKNRKARTQAGSLVEARYYFGFTLPLSVDWGWPAAWGRGWRVGERERERERERGGMM